jgi:hypothetical protein
MIALMAKAVGGLYCPIKAGLRLSMKACTASERLAVAASIRSDRNINSRAGDVPTRRVKPRPLSSLSVRAISSDDFCSATGRISSLGDLAFAGLRGTIAARCLYMAWPLGSSGGSERRAAERSAFVPSTTRSRVERYENSAQVHHNMQYNALSVFLPVDKRQSLCIIMHSFNKKSQGVVHGR